MSDDFSQSLTPPVSPFAGDSLCDLAPVRPPCFCCSDVKDDPAGVLSTEGYVVRGSLKRLLLRLDPAPAEYETDTVDIFGFSWVTETALVESTKLLFGLFRQRIYKLETLHPFDVLGQAGNLHYKAEELWQECVTFLQYVKVFLHRYLQPSRSLDAAQSHPYEELEAQFPSALLEELFGITLLVGRLKDLPANVQSAFTIQNHGKILPPSWHLLHLHLDIHWSVLEILHLLGHKIQGQVVYAHKFVDLTGENLTDSSLFDEHLCSLLCDLTGLAMGKYSKVRPTEALSSHHYLCTCTKELWVLLMYLLEHRNKELHTQSFWSYINSLLRPLVLGKPAAEQFSGLPTHCKDPLGFTWWLVTHLSMLGQYSRSGMMVQNEKNLGDNWTFVDELLKLSCKGGLAEEQFRMHVHSCLSLCLMWEPSTSAVSTLWDYYSKNLSASFTVPWLGISALGTLCKTPLALLEQARSCCSLPPLRSPGYTQLYRSANSFHIFLRVLALCLAQDRAGGVPQRQIKGRIYSKFSPKKMQELSEAGLMNFLLLFLVVARQADLEDVASRACELLGFLPSNSPLGHRTLIWRGHLSMVLLFQERGLDVGAQASLLTSSFNETAKEFYNKTTEVSRRLALWGPLGSYLEGVAEVFETSTTLSLSEEKLLGDGFNWLLPACRQSELNSALGFLQIVLAQLRRVHQRSDQSAPTLSWVPATASVVKERHLAVAAALWAHFFPFLHSLRLSQTPPAQLADAAAGFTLLAFDLPTSAPQDLQPNSVQSIMQYFGWDDMVHPLLVTRYLSHLLQNSELVSSLSGDPGVAVSGSAQSLSVRAWVRCVLQQHLHKNPDGTDSRTARAVEQQLCELTRLVLRLPEVERLLQRANLNPTATRPEPTAALEMFVKAVGSVYSGLKVLSERSAMVTTALDYIGDILKHIKPSLVSKNQEGIQLAYWAVGCIVKHWSPLLATSKAQQLLFRIVDGLLLPHNLTQQDKALRDSLPLYIQGLSVASSVSQSQGAYLKQQLRSVTRRYLDHFLPASPSVGIIANHPVLLGACEANPTSRGAALRRLILEVLCENFLQFKGHAPPPRLASVLMFLLELLRRNGDSDPSLLTIIIKLQPLLSIIFIHLFIYYAYHLDALRSFVEENEGVYDRQIYGILETVAVLDPTVVQALIPNLSLSLRNTEHKRGLGKNIALRSAYVKLLGLLGESGQAEITSLESE
uniref:Protein MMS22-like n=1 Tax=Astatotilapia calliptera TaxID=8154 RepID=A0AAX7U7K7_ASTCA